MASRALLEPYDTIERRVLLAVELVDPIRRSLVVRDVRVQPVGFEGKPILSRSGRHVWLARGDDGWPALITVVPEGLPFAPERVLPARPAHLDHPTPAERLVRVTLRPTAAYPFADGLTVVRGRLRETALPGAPPVPDARVQLAWHDRKGDKWVPLPPPPEDVDEDAEDAPTPREPQTDSRGEFGVFLDLRKSPAVDLDLDGGLLRVRLQVTRGRRVPVTRVTPDDFPFLEEGAPLPPARRGRVYEGRLLGRDVGIAWADLDPV